MGVPHTGIQARVGGLGVQEAAKKEGDVWFLKNMSPLGWSIHNYKTVGEKKTGHVLRRAQGLRVLNL